MLLYSYAKNFINSIIGSAHASLIVNENRNTIMYELMCVKWQYDCDYNMITVHPFLIGE